MAINACYGIKIILLGVINMEVKELMNRAKFAVNTGRCPLCGEKLSFSFKPTDTRNFSMSCLCGYLVEMG